MAHLAARIIEFSPFESHKKKKAKNSKSTNMRINVLIKVKIVIIRAKGYQMKKNDRKKLKYRKAEAHLIRSCQVGVLNQQNL